MAKVGLHCIKPEVQVGCHLDVGEMLRELSSTRTSALVSGSGSLPGGRDGVSLRTCRAAAINAWRLSVRAVRCRAGNQVVDKWGGGVQDSLDEAVAVGDSQSFSDQLGCLVRGPHDRHAGPKQPQLQVGADRRS